MDNRRSRIKKPLSNIEIEECLERVLNHKCVNELFNWLKDSLKRRDWRMIVNVIGSIHDYFKILVPEYERDDVDRVVDYFIMKELEEKFLF